MSTWKDARHSVQMLVFLCILGVCTVSGQQVQHPAPAEEDLLSYYAALAAHFDLPPREVLVLSEWPIPPPELAVVFHVATRTGVSPDVVVRFRREGRSWMELARGLGLDAGDFHLTVEPPPREGALGRALEVYRRTPPDRWEGIRLEDDGVVALVNLRILAGALDHSRSELVGMVEEAGGYVEVVRRLRPHP